MADSSEQRRKFKAMVPFFADDGSLLTAEREREALRTAVVDLDLDPDEAHGAIRQAARERGIVLESNTAETCWLSRRATARMPPRVSVLIEASGG